MIATKKTGNYSHSEREYKKIKAVNQSGLRVFDEDPLKFYQQFVLGEKKMDKPSFSQIVGSLADFYLLDCHGDEDEFLQRFDEKFARFEGIKGDSQVFILADELFDITMRDCNEDGEITTEFEIRFNEAFEKVQRMGKYKNKTYEAGMVDFNSKGKKYFDTLLNNKDKEVCDDYQVDKAKRIVEQLRGDEWHGDFINKKSEGEIEVLKKIGIEFPYKTTMGNIIECKCELDFLHINHNEKVIYRRDLKTAFDNEEFDYSYIKHRYYLQNAFYHLGVKYFAEQNGMDDYEVLPMSFLVLDTSSNSRRPLLYNTSSVHVNQGLDGFTYNGKNHKGVSELMEAIDWALNNGVWNCSKENYLNKGIITLKEFN